MKSNYTDKEITQAQYLAEFICQRIAKKEKKNLFNHFWNSPEWKKEFQKQVILANKLLESYSLTEITNVLNTYKGKRVFSLGANWALKSLLTTEAKKRNQQNKTEIKKIENEVPKQIFKKKSILDEL